MITTSVSLFNIVLITSQNNLIHFIFTLELVTVQHYMTNNASLRGAGYKN